MTEMEAMTEMDHVTEIYMASLDAEETAAKLRRLHSYMLGEKVSDDRVIVELQKVDRILHGMRDRLLRIRKEKYHDENRSRHGRLRHRQGGE